MGDTLGGSYMAVKPLLQEKAVKEPMTTSVANCGKATWWVCCLVRAYSVYFLTSGIAGTSSGISMRITVPSLGRLWM